MQTRRKLMDDREEGHAKGQPSASEPTHGNSAATASQSDWRLVKDDERAAHYHEETPSNYVTLNTFEELTAHLKTATCRRCQEPFFASELNIRRLFQDWADGAVDELSCNVPCSSCNMRSCIACEPEPNARPSGIVSRSSKRGVSWCCVGGRLFLIWALLCGFDRHIWESRDIGKISEASKLEPKARKTANKPTHGSATGLGGGYRVSTGRMPPGMGYGGHGYDLHEESDNDYDTDDNEEGDYSGNLDDPDYMPSVSKGSAHTLGHMLNLKEPKKETKVSEAQKVQICEDVFSDMVLGFLTDLLPSLERETCFDFDPPKAVLEMLRNSKILQYCAELLRNDSLADVIKRKNLYQTLFNFLMTMGSHGETSAALFGPRFVRPETVDLLTLSFCAAAPDPSESVSILAECLRNLTTQSAMVLLSAKNNGQYFKNQEGQQMLLVCRNISALSQFIQDQTPVEASSKKGKETAVVPEDLAVREVEESLMERTYYYYRQAKALESSRPGRFKRLVTEITTLQTSLPPGIFVRYCENRPDILKCVIVGPMGTPYENGLFEFDFFCPTEYPNVPPLANFKGTAGGRISINPNLYAEGKVCLSLLGTWSGEPWKPGESTLLQVLISIQAMILCDEPWYNEPGREAGYTRSLNSPSAMYNSKIREHTVRTAIMAWLESPKPIWKDVVDHHFNEHGNAILKTVEEWTKDKRSPVKRSRPEVVPDDDGLYDYDDIFNTVRGQPVDVQDMGTMLFRIQKMLKERYKTTFEVTYVPPVKKPTPPPATPRRLNLSSSPWTMFGPPPLDAEASASGAPPLGFASPALAPPPSLSPSSSATDSIGFYQQQLAAAAATPGRGGYPQVMGRGAFPGGHSFLSNNPYKSDGSVAMPNTQGASSMGLPSVAPRYDTRSTTRGRGEHGLNPGMRGGRGGSSLGTPLLPSGGNVNMGRGRGNMTIGYGGLGLAGLGRGHGTGEGDIQGGQANTFTPFFSSTPNFGRGRGAAPPGDIFTLGDLSSGARGRGSAGGRGARGGRGGRGRGRGRGGRGDGGGP